MLDGYDNCQRARQTLQHTDKSVKAVVTEGALHTELVRTSLFAFVTYFESLNESHREQGSLTLASTPEL